MPTKEDYVTQIKADLETDEGESEEVLNERLKRVEATDSDEDAKAAYFGHLKEIQERGEVGNE